MSIFSSNSMNLSSVHLKPSHHVKTIFTLHSNFYNLIYTLNSPHAPSTCQLWHTPHPTHLATIIPKKANTYYDQDLTNNHRKKKKKIIKYFTTKKISCNHTFFFSPIFFQLIFLRPLSRLRNFLISFTIHKIRARARAASPHKQKKDKKNAKNATITTTTPREVVVDNSNTFLFDIFRQKKHQILPSTPPIENSRFYQYIFQHF